MLWFLFSWLGVTQEWDVCLFVCFSTTGRLMLLGNSLEGIRQSSSCFSADFKENTMWSTVLQGDTRWGLESDFKLTAKNQRDFSSRISRSWVLLSTEWAEESLGSRWGYPEPTLSCSAVCCGDENSHPKPLSFKMKANNNALWHCWKSHQVWWFDMQQQKKIHRMINVKREMCNNLKKTGFSKQKVSRKEACILLKW